MRSYKRGGCGTLTVQCDPGGYADSKSSRTTVIKKEWESNELGLEPVHVTAKLTIFLEFSLRDAHLCVYNFLLCLAVWELWADVWLLRIQTEIKLITYFSILDLENARDHPALIY
jgi:hypothetical protein